MDKVNDGANLSWPLLYIYTVEWVEFLAIYLATRERERVRDEVQKARRERERCDAYWT